MADIWAHDRRSGIEQQAGVLSVVLATASTGFAILIVALYFLPTVVAACRKATNGGSVFLINLLLGWTIIGWWMALGLSASGAATRQGGRQCPACGTPPKQGQTECRRCGFNFAAAAVGAPMPLPATPPRRQRLRWEAGRSLPPPPPPQSPFD